MTKHLIAAAGAATVLLTGCHYTRIATPQLTPEEQRWEDLIRESYPSYNPPPKTTRSFNGNPEKRTSAYVETGFQPMNDPAPAETEVKTDAPEEIPAEPEKTPEENAADQAQTAAGEQNNDAAQQQDTAQAEENAPAAENQQQESSTATGATPPDPTNSIVYEVKSGDSLGSIARQMYGDARFSNIIFKANADILKDPNTLRPGMKLIVPKL